jgi:predicted signal transduction protein with EAL and GGDEF domain
MSSDEHREEQLRQELEEFKREKERVRNVLGRIGGKSHAKVDMTFNAIILGVIIVLFAVEFITGWIPTRVALEISVLLVSVKIVWMIHSNSRSYHFQFWVLNSIEFRINEMTRIVRRLEHRISRLEEDDEEEDDDENHRDAAAGGSR